MPGEKLRLHSLQHVSFEGLAHVEEWARVKGHRISRTLLFNDDPFPSMGEFDWLVILGGPMNIYEEEKYPWLKREKKFIAEAIAQQKVVLGVCLGAQLIADVLGGKVTQNPYREIGWYPVRLSAEAKNSPIFDGLPSRFMAFHWHGDTFAIPPGALRIAESDGCTNQALEYNGRTIGLQFHLESSIASIQKLIQNCADEIGEGEYIQKPGEMMRQKDHVPQINKLMGLLLDNLEKRLIFNKKINGS
jgi:GMP synthase (glutamine-hydrolysing)